MSKRAPEVVVDAARVDIAQDVAQLAQGLCAASGRDDGQRAVLDRELDHGRTSFRQLPSESTPPGPDHDLIVERVHEALEEPRDLVGSRKSIVGLRGRSRLAHHDR